MKKIKLDGFQEIPNTDGKYLIHPDGRVYSRYSNKILTHTIQKDGRRTVSMKYVGSKGTAVAVSRLLAETFLPNPDNLKYVILKDGDPRNLNLSNVEWSNSKPKHDGGKYVRGYGNKYKIYPDGRVFNTKSRSYLKHFHSKSGDVRVTLIDDSGKLKQYSLSVLLYTHYIGFLSDEKKVVHKDGDRLNIALENLTYTFKR